ncbi:hypothetical protein [Rhizobium sp. WL3]|uniref:hypothetical protein n=1 Tax=Rhizobium sp. WL3 TaxID=2603277 RepID=UPI00164F3ABF|nr:hypothetical protein [Rhizobium sp. WL3]
MPMLLQGEDFIVQSALRQLDDTSSDVRRVVIDLVRSGFEDLEELVHLAGIAKETLLSTHQDEQTSI